MDLSFCLGTSTGCQISKGVVRLRHVSSCPTKKNPTFFCTVNMNQRTFSNFFWASAVKKSNRLGIVLFKREKIAAENGCRMRGSRFLPRFFLSTLFLSSSASKSLCADMGNAPQACWHASSRDAQPRVCRCAQEMHTTHPEVQMSKCVVHFPCVLTHLQWIAFCAAHCQCCSCTNFPNANDSFTYLTPSISQ